MKNIYDFSNVFIKNYITSFRDVSFPFSEKLNHKLFNQLVSSIEPLVVQVLIAEYEGFREVKKYKSTLSIDYFKEYMKDIDYIDNLLLNFPIMKNKINKRIDNFLKYCEEIKDNLDKNNIQFEKIENIEMSIGDYHNNGQSVCKIQLDKTSYFYKPRGAYTDLKFHVYLNELLGEKYKIKNILNFDDFSLHEEIKYHSNFDSIDEVNNYFYIMGYISSIFYFLNTSDMHYENIIVNENRPYFIDLETLTDISSHSSYTFENSVLDFLTESSLHSMVYPYSLEENILDISATTGREYQAEEFIYQNSQYHFSETGELVKTQLDPYFTQQKNEVFFEGIKQEPYKYLKNILDGFKDFSNRVLYNKKKTYEELLNLIDSESIRQVLRPTHIYSKIIDIGNEPYYLINEHNYNELFDDLRKGNHDKRVLESEINQLKNLDVPTFYSKVFDSGVYTGEKLLKDEFFTVKMEDTIKEKVFSFSEKVLLNELSNIEQAFITYSFNNSNGVEDFSNLEFKSKEKLSIFFEKFKESNNSASILLSTFNDKTAFLSPIGPSVFDYGFYLLLATYYKNDIKFETKKLIKILSTMKDWKTFSLNESLTGFSGVGSYLYLLINAYAKTSNPWFKEEIKLIIKEVQTKKIIPKNMDYFTGISSFLAVLSELYIFLKKEDKEPSLIKNVYKLIHLYLTWISDNISSMDNSNTRIGLSHGYSGIIKAISRANKIVNQNDYVILIEKLLEKEELYYDYEKNNYYDLRTKDNNKFYICYGLPGILLSRVELYENGFNHLKNSIIFKGNKLAKSIINDEINIKDYDYSICHGVTGLIECMIELKKLELVNKDLANNALAILNENIVNNMKNGFSQFSDIETFLFGNGGKLYTDLRLNDEFPSIMRLKILSN